MHELVVEPLLQADQLAVQAASELRWGPLTALFVLASAWWVKGPLFVLAGLARDLKNRALLLPTALAVAASLLAADLLSGAIKQAVDRPRPPRADPGFEGALAVASSPRFRSGHATTTFACAVAIAIFVPKLR